MRLRETLQQLVADAGQKVYGSLPPFDVVEPPQKEFGDFSTALPLQISRRLKKDPVVLASRLRTEILRKKLPDWVNEVTVTRPGYLNFILDSHSLAKSVLREPVPPAKKIKPKPKLSLEHTQVNPNKAVHVGHLRNAALGDSLAKILRFLGHNLEVINYIDNTGVQVVDSFLAFKKFGNKQQLARNKQRLDHLLWELYPRIQKEYEAEPSLLKERVRLLQRIEEGQNQEAEELLRMTRRVVKEHLLTLARLGVFYDLLVWEGDVLKTKLWEKVFNLLKKRRIVIKEKVGPNAGAWVVRFGSDPREDKILVKSDGTTTYTAKDLAYELWKFGRTTSDFRYGVFSWQQNGTALWTTKEGTDKPVRPLKDKKFGQAEKVIVVIDTRQSYPQTVIKEVLKRLGFKKEAENYHHLAYGVVYLSPKTFQSLGYKTTATEEDKKAFAFSGRAGIGVKADDLLDQVEATVKKINPKLSAKALRALARAIVRYYLLSSRVEKDLIFDTKSALSTDGNTGAYLLYAYARASNILKKAGEKSVSPRFPTLLTEEEKALLKKIALSEETIQNAARELDPSFLCDYLWQLSNLFARFYETNPVISAPEPQRSFRLRLVAAFREILELTLRLLGIEPLEKI